MLWLNRYSLWLLVWIKCASATIFYSKHDRRTYNDSLKVCQSLGGSLLKYGGLFNKVIQTCEPKGTDINVWIGSPFYIPYYRCTNISAETAFRTPQENRTKDKHVASCADFCKDEKISVFYVQTDECGCYEDEPPIRFYCNSYRCPGNEFDLCGSGTLMFMLYLKVYSLECIFRRYLNSSSSGQEFNPINEPVDCNSNNTYICQVGDSDKIDCKSDEELISEGYRKPSIDPTSPMPIDGLITAHATTYQQFSITDTLETRTELSHISPDLGLIIGLAVSALLNVTLVAVVCRMLALRRTSHQQTNRGPNRGPNMTHSLHEYDTVQPSGRQSDYLNMDNIYTKDNHTYCDLYDQTGQKPTNPKE